MTVRACALIKEYHECFDYYLENLPTLSEHQVRTMNDRMKKLDAEILKEAEEVEGINVYAHRVKFLTA